MPNRTFRMTFWRQERGACNQQPEWHGDNKNVTTWLVSEHPIWSKTTKLPTNIIFNESSVFTLLQKYACVQFWRKSWNFWAQSQLTADHGPPTIRLWIFLVAFMQKVNISAILHQKEHTILQRASLYLNISWKYACVQVWKHAGTEPRNFRIFFRLGHGNIFMKY